MSTKSGEDQLNVKYYNGKFDAYQRTYVIESLDKTALDVRYLYRFLDSYLEYLRRLSIGGVIKYIKLENLTEARIPLPPLPEQRKVVEILDKADELRAKRRAALAQLDTLTQSIFLDMFGDPTTNPKGWPQEDLKTFFFFRTGKLDSNAAEPGGKYPFFTCAQENFQIDTFAFDCEALLLAGNNANADYSVKYYKGKFNAYQRTYVITLQDERNSYAYARFVLEHKLAELKRISKGTNTKYITLELLNRMRVPVPPTELQERCEKVVTQVNQHKTANLTTASKFDTLFASLQHRAFQGDLWLGSDEASEVVHEFGR
ncbi:MAG: restriction endonuclease subunit S [Nitrospira sp.]|nr:restriction endonuclease subunit S [Nitrospira sp.]